jgi:hypothetical protein
MAIITDPSKAVPARKSRQPRSHTYCSKYIKDPIAREKFSSLMTEADRLHTAATELRMEAWEIYRARDQQYSQYA